MPFELKNIPATFQTLMNSLFRDYLGRFRLVSMNDILMYSKKVKEHKLHPKQIFEILKESKLYVKLSKCASFTSHILFFGHVISDKEISTDPKKIKMVVEWPISKDKIEVKKS